MSTLNKLVTWLIVIMIASFAISGFFFNRYGLHFKGVNIDEVFTQIEHLEERTIHEEDIDMSSIKKITIETTSANIELDQKTQDASGMVILSGTAPEGAVRLDIDASEDELTIKVVREDGLLSIKHLQLSVTLPDTINPDITIDTVSGDAQADIIQSQQFEYNSISGDLESESLKAKDIKLDTKSGDVHLSSVVGDFELNTTSGDLYVFYENFANDVKVESVSGDIRLSFAEPIDFDLDFKTTSGDSDIGVPVKIKKSEDREFQATAGDGGNKIEISTVSGDLRIH